MDNKNKEIKLIFDSNGKTLRAYKLTNGDIFTVANKNISPTTVEYQHEDESMFYEVKAIESNIPFISYYERTGRKFTSQEFNNYMKGD